MVTVFAIVFKLQASNMQTCRDKGAWCQLSSKHADNTAMHPLPPLPRGEQQMPKNMHMLCEACHYPWFVTAYTDGKTEVGCVCKHG